MTLSDEIKALVSTLEMQLQGFAQTAYAKDLRIADLERQLAEASAPAVERQRWSHITPRDFVEVATAIMDQHGLMDDLSYEKTEKLCEAMEESFKKLPHPAPQAADTDKVREAMTRIANELEGAAGAYSGDFPDEIARCVEELRNAASTIGGVK